MTIVRIGTTKKYSDGWTAAFAGKKSAKTTAAKNTGKTSSKKPKPSAKKKSKK